MKEYNTFGLSFGPVASFAGQIIFVVGIVVTAIISFTGVFLAILGAFIGFSNSGTTLYFENRMARFTNNIFGLIKIGKRVQITDNMYLEIRTIKNVSRSHSLSNRVLDIRTVQTVIYLMDAHNRAIMPIKKTDPKLNANRDLEELGKKLKLEIR